MFAPLLPRSLFRTTQHRVTGLGYFFFHCLVWWALTMIDAPHFACSMPIILLLFIIIESVMQSFWIAHRETAHHIIDWELSAVARHRTDSKSLIVERNAIVSDQTRARARAQTHHPVKCIYMTGPNVLFTFAYLQVEYKILRVLCTPHQNWQIVYMANHARFVWHRKNLLSPPIFRISFR